MHIKRFTKLLKLKNEAKFANGNKSVESFLLRVLIHLKLARFACASEQNDTSGGFNETKTFTKIILLGLSFVTTALKA